MSAALAASTNPKLLDSDVVELAAPAAPGRQRQSIRMGDALRLARILERWPEEERTALCREARALASTGKVS